MYKVLRFLIFVMTCLIMASHVRGQAVNSVVRAESIGLKADLSSDNSNILNDFLAFHSNVEIAFSKGTYVFDNISIRNPGITISGDNTIFKPAVTALSQGVILIKASKCSVKNLTIDGSKNDSLKAGIEIINTENITLTALKIKNIGYHGIAVSASNKILISDCEVSHCYNGIQFWGGDAKFHTGSGVSDIVVKSCRVYDMAEAGIWGSMGTRIQFKNNDVHNCLDVGLDLEGCANSVISDNSASNCKNGCISLFYGSHNIKIFQNRAHPFNNQIGIKFFNSNYVIRHVDVSKNVITGNNCQGVHLDEGAAKQVTFRDNLISGRGTSGLRAIFCDSINVIANRINLQNASFGVSNEGGDNWHLADNHITNVSSADKKEPSKGIFIYWSSNKHPAMNNHVTGNTIFGYDASILEDSWGDLQKPENEYSKNTLESLYQSSGRKKSTNLKLNNRKYSLPKTNQSVGQASKNNVGFKSDLKNMTRIL